MPTPLENQTHLTRTQLVESATRFRLAIKHLREFDFTCLVREDELEPLIDRIKRAVSETFAENSPQYKMYIRASHFNLGPHFDVIGHVHEEQAQSSKTRSMIIMQCALDELKDYLRNWGDDTNTEVDVLETVEVRKERYSRKVFIVHGHDDGSREGVARFLEKLGFTPIILQEQPNQGRAVFEKFEDYADVGFAIALFTPDDDAMRDKKRTKRARQNVVLELGYFAGKLDRKRVCVVKRGNVEMPSDMHGIVSIEYDGGRAWQLELSRELTAAGYEIDWAKLAA